MKKYRILLFFLSIIIPAFGFGQSVIGSLNATSNNASWTAGEMVVFTSSTGSLSVTHGFHQPLTDGTLNIEEFHEQGNLGLEINAYPNPARERLFISVDTDRQRNITLTLLSVEGKQIKSMVVNTAQDKVAFSLQGIDPGIYLLRADSENASSISKIIKQ